MYKIPWIEAKMYGYCSEIAIYQAFTVIIKKKLVQKVDQLGSQQSLEFCSKLSAVQSFEIVRKFVV